MQDVYSSKSDDHFRLYIMTMRSSIVCFRNRQLAFAFVLSFIGGCLLIFTVLNQINFASIINNIHVAKVHGQRQSNTSQMNQKGRVIMGQWLDSISLAVFKSESTLVPTMYDCII